jgi:hypothetical protein
MGSNVQSMAVVRKSIGAEQSCAFWTNVRTDAGKLGMQSWALGFVSGINWTTTGKDRLDHIDANAIYSWIDNYCGQHPLETFANAVRSLAQELENRTRQ